MNRQISNLPSRSRLRNSVKKSIETTFIGAVVRIEEHLGYLWGHGKTEKTKEEEEFLKIWTKLRDQIMVCGQKEIKRMDNELDKYVIQYNNYQYKFTVRGNNGNA